MPPHSRALRLATVGLRGSAQLSLRQVHLPEHRGKTRVAAKRRERRVVPEIVQIAIVLLVGPIQPFESLVLLAAPRIDLRDTVSPSLPPLGDKLIECLLRFFGVTQLSSSLRSLEFVRVRCT